jgi:hypothetical protein
MNSPRRTKADSRSFMAMERGESLLRRKDVLLACKRKARINETAAIHS